MNLNIIKIGASQVALVVRNPPVSAAEARDEGSFPGLGRSPCIGRGNPLQYSFLENSMDRGAWPSVMVGKEWPEGQIQL